MDGSISNHQQQQQQEEEQHLSTNKTKHTQTSKKDNTKPENHLDLKY